MTPSDTLRAAAERLRELATDATPGPWRNRDTHLGQYGYTATVLSGDGNTTQLRAWLPTMSQEPWDETRNAWADSAYIAAMHPGVGNALAAWLESWTGIEVAEDGPLAEDLRHALTVARQILGSTA
ncbi:hypothetical protein [Streptomyces albidoflavus]|uniref:hypothetical protein n=1 Tax=Streptomyces albidoflavus TaxID=1886 RepID=UPI00386EFBD5|nr:ead/Ea22-like family protein [Streptomyces albidoflavus]